MAQQDGALDIREVERRYLGTASLGHVKARPNPVGTSHEVVTENPDANLTHVEDQRFERGELTAWDYNLEILDGLAGPEDELEAFLRTIGLDPGATALMAWCEKRDVPFRVLSDGFDRNIDRLMEIHGVRFDYEANQLRYEGGTWRIAASHPNPGCTCGTGCCKAGRIDALRVANPGVVVAHVGNGRVSDLCGALAADVAFAKDSLAEELRRRGARYEPFETLHEVVRSLERIWDG